MNNLELKIFTLGILYDNSYLVYDKETRNAFIVDVPSPFDAVVDFINKEKLNVLFIALTHGHFDHIGSLDDVSFPFCIHRKDAEFLKNPTINGSVLFDLTVDIKRKPAFFLEEKEPLPFDDFKIKIIHTPGHTPGSVCLLLDKWLFTGDTLFYGSVGRTDIPLASQEALIGSIKGKILLLPEDTIVYPGHGQLSTIGEEISSNPFLR